MTNEKILKKVIEKAKKNGWEGKLPPIDDIELLLQATESIIFSHDFAKAFWGKRRWETSLSKIKHEWEVDHYQADTAKTPVYRCKKSCTASKINNIIYYDQEGCDKTDDIELAGYKSLLASSHNVRLLQGWEYHLQTMVLCENPLEYLAKFLTEPPDNAKMEE